MSSAPYPDRFQPDAAFAERLDSDDPLASFRDRFHIPPGPGATPSIYFCGNSLGLQPKSARAYVDKELEDWAALGVEGHLRAAHPWLPYHELLTGQTARLVGALPPEVVVMNTLTVNLHLMMVSFFRPSGRRRKIMIEHSAFPSDRYAVQSQLRYHGLDPERDLIEIRPRTGEATLRTEDIEAAIARDAEDIALILFSGVNYYTGQFFDLPAIAHAARARGIPAGFDLAHAVGNVPLALHDWDVDFACWCSYKYLNGGPGCTAGCFVHECHIGRADLPRFEGWWGTRQDSRFLMRPDFDPAPSVEAWQLSNPAILPLAALRASMEIFEEADLRMLRRKSAALTGYLEYLLLRDSAKGGWSIITPSDADARGCQLSLRIPSGGKALFDRLTAAGVVADWREPDVIRAAPVPLYNSFRDVRRFHETFLAASAASPAPHLTNPEHP